MRVDILAKEERACTALEPSATIRPAARPFADEIESGSVLDPPYNVEVTATQHALLAGVQTKIEERI